MMTQTEARELARTLNVGRSSARAIAVTAQGARGEFDGPEPEWGILLGDGKFYNDQDKLPEGYKK